MVIPALILMLLLLFFGRRNKKRRTAVRESVRINTLLQNIEAYDGTDRRQKRLEDIK